MTAVAVRDILPLQHAQLLKMCVVVNDDDVAPETLLAGKASNGHMMHSFADDEGETR